MPATSERQQILNQADMATVRRSYIFAWDKDEEDLAEDCLLALSAEQESVSASRYLSDRTRRIEKNSAALELLLECMADTEFR